MPLMARGTGNSNRVIIIVVCNVKGTRFSLLLCEVGSCLSRIQGLRSGIKRLVSLGGLVNLQCGSEPLSCWTSINSLFQEELSELFGNSFVDSIQIFDLLLGLVTVATGGGGYDQCYQRCEAMEVSLCSLGD